MSAASKPLIETSRLELAIAVLAIVAIVLHLLMRFLFHTAAFTFNLPLFAALIFGGVPLVWELLKKLLRREFGSDLLAGISIVTSVLLGEYLAGTLVVLMLSGGEALEAYAVRSASSVLEALSRRMSNIAHRKKGDAVEDIPLDDVQIGDELLVLPHEACPVDGVVVSGHGVMDESYLTGEPYMLSKSPGSEVISGSVNGETAMTIRAEKLAIDSRYAKIMEVMRTSQQQRPQLRRLGDQLGAWYTPLAVLIGIAAWYLSGDPVRFLAVMVVATPCPLLIAIPVAIIGSISLSAKRAIIIRDPLSLEKIDTCQTVIFDKTGTLTYGTPKLVAQVMQPQFTEDEVLSHVASIERYSRHPLANAIVEAAAQKHLYLHSVDELSERPGEGLRGVVGSHVVRITGRGSVEKEQPAVAALLPPVEGGLECVIFIDDSYAATYRFRDVLRRDGKSFISHLKPRHKMQRVMLLSGDRAEEVEHLAKQVGIETVYAGKTPEEKLEIVQAETKLANTLYVGDGINDAPALMAATVGIAFGQHSDVTTEAAGVVILDSSLEKVDEVIHIGARMRSIALQSAVGGMALSICGMFFASAGMLSPVAGALMQEAIDVIAVLNALRVSFVPESLTDYEQE